MPVASGNRCVFRGRAGHADPKAGYGRVGTLRSATPSPGEEPLRLQWWAMTSREITLKRHAHFVCRERVRTCKESGSPRASRRRDEVRSRVR